MNFIFIIIFFYRSIQILLEVKIGLVIKFLNIIGKINEKKTNEVEEIEILFDLPVGSIPPPEVLFLKHLTSSTRQRALEMHAKSFVKQGMKFNSLRKMNLFLKHLEFMYKSNLRQRKYDQNRL